MKEMHTYNAGIKLSMNMGAIITSNRTYLEHSPSHSRKHVYVFPPGRQPREQEREFDPGQQNKEHRDFFVPVGRLLQK